VALVTVDGVLPLPTRATEILETLEVSAEVGPHDTTAHCTQGVLQVGVYLDLLAEFWSLDFNKASLDCLHEAALVAEGNAARTNGVLVAISVDAGIDHTPK
jgi:hypothetical protein